MPSKAVVPKAFLALPPVVLMGYANPIEAMGVDVFAAAAFVPALMVFWSSITRRKKARPLPRGDDGQCPDPIFLLAPTSTPERISMVSAQASGYVYYVSLKGVTGSATLDVDAVAARIPEIHAATGVPVGVGFGIRDAATAGAVARIADA